MMAKRTEFRSPTRPHCRKNSSSTRPYEFDRGLFGIDEVPEEDVQKHASDVATSLIERGAASPLQSHSG
jgi:hypothetical protein